MLDSHSKNAKYHTQYAKTIFFKEIVLITFCELISSINSGGGQNFVQPSVGDKTFTPFFANKKAVTVSVFRRFHDLLLMSAIAENSLSAFALES